MATTPATASNKGYHSQHPSLETGTLLRDIMSRSKAVSFPDCDVLVSEFESTCTRNASVSQVPKTIIINYSRY